jgi:hypothetical protein
MNKHIHAYLDYPVGLGLILMPMLLNIGSTNQLAFWLSVATGFAALLLTFLTDHHLGVMKVLPYKLHLAVDFLVGVTFLLAPLALGLSGLDAAYFWVLGAVVVVVVTLDKSQPEPQIA